MTAWRIIEGDCLKAMAAIDAESVDAVVTDPPYSFAFAGAKWDSHPSPAAFQAWCQEWSTQCLRVLRPGGHMLAFGGTRTYHRLAAGVEDAGFEIRDQIQWLHSQGFPKGHNVGNGHGTNLKPAHEPIVLARKPLAGTVTQNFQAHGTGALNIDGCRIPAANKTRFPVGDYGPRGLYGKDGERTGDPDPDTRWPANIALDPEAAAMLSKQGGQPKDRFFYVPKATRREREAGLGADFAEGDVHPPSGDDRVWDVPGSRPARRKNIHTTVKPVALMRWLVRLVCPPGGLVLDPFAGSGTTGIAACLEDMEFVGVEREREYAAVARARIAAWREHADEHHDQLVLVP